MSERVRKYTYQISCPLPMTRKQKEARALTSYVYDVPDAHQARVEWFRKHLSSAQANGLHVDRRFIRTLWDNLPLIVTRVQKGSLILRNAA